eukprot:3978465-Prymnesium_polylepis.1
MYLVRGVHTWPAIITHEDTAVLIKIDAVARGHQTQREFSLRQFKMINAHTWNGKWAGPTGASWPMADGGARGRCRALRGSA